VAGDEPTLTCGCPCGSGGKTDGDTAGGRAGGREPRPEALAAARREVHAAKVGLGERAPVWWTDRAPDFNRNMARNTPYAAWFAALGPLDESVTS
jgi:hypothetical protein